MIPLGAVRLSSRQGRALGQVEGPLLKGPLLAVTVTLDGGPAGGVPVEIMFANGSSVNGLTDDASGMFQTEYNYAQYGQAIVRITAPPEVEDIGEGSAQGITLSATPANLSFELTSVPAADITRNLVAAAVATAITMAFGLSS
jgi:hypothetical protein